MQLSRVGLPVGVTSILSVLWVRWDGSISFRGAPPPDLVGLSWLGGERGEAWPDGDDFVFFELLLLEVPSFFNLSRCTASRHFVTMPLATSATSRLGFLRIWLTVLPMEVARRLASVAMTPVLRSLRRLVRMEGAALALAALVSSFPFFIISALSMVSRQVVCWNDYRRRGRWILKTLRSDVWKVSIYGRNRL